MTLENAIKGLVVVVLIVLIVMMAIGMHVMLNPDNCSKYASIMDRLRPPALVYSKSCTECTECGEPGEDGKVACAKCGACSAEGFHVNRVQDIERIPWDQPTNVDPTVQYPGEEGFYTGDTEESRNIQDIVLSSAISDDVKQNHTAFIDQTLTAQPIPGASHLGIRDDYNPPNKWWGLKRDALHKQRGALGDSRTVQSETPEQVADFAYRGNNYLL